MRENSQGLHLHGVDRVRTAYVMRKGLVLAELTQEFSSLSGDSLWILRPLYENFPEAMADGWLGMISGFDLDVRKEEYVRDFVPAFVTERQPDPRRKDLADVLAEYGMTNFDRFELLCHSYGLATCDELYVSRDPNRFVDSRANIYEFEDFTNDYNSEGWL